jgi:hypothetical protein
VWSETEIGARVRKSRQKEAAGAADAVLMQIEWSEAEVLKSAGVGTEAELEVVESVGRRIDGGKRWAGGREIGIRTGAGRTGAKRGEPCSRASRIPSALLRASYLRYGGVWSNQKSGDGDECHGTHGCAYPNAIPASGVGSGTRSHRSEESTSQTTSQRTEGAVKNDRK